MDLLNLKTLKTVSLKELNSHFEIEVENDPGYVLCPHCLNTQLHSHGKTWQGFFDIPMQGKPVVLRLNRIRYKCLECNKTHREPLEDVDGKRLMTSRLVQYIQKRAMRDTFSVISKDTGLDEKTIRHVFDDYAVTASQNMPIETPRILGIDELKLVGDYRCILTNIEQNSVFDMLPSRRKDVLRPYLKELKDKENVEQVTMDMWRPYRDAVNAELPGRIIVIDKFHIVRMASEALESARKRIKSSLERKDRLKLKNERFVLLKRRVTLTDKEVEDLHRWSALHPDLGLAYDAKEAFYCLFDQGLDSETAQEALVEWQRGLTPEITNHFEPLISALKNWMPEILNGFDYPVTNAYTESINRLAKDIQRMGRGYSFDVIRAKMLYDKLANEPTTKTIRRKVRRPVEENDFEPNMSLMGSFEPTKFENITEEKQIYYGPHIPTLCDLLEKGHFD